MLALDSRSLIQPNSGLARLSFLPVYRRLPSCCGTAETPGTNFSLPPPRKGIFQLWP